MHHIWMPPLPSLNSPIGTPFTPDIRPNSEGFQPDIIAADPYRALTTPVANPRPTPDQRPRLTLCQTLLKPRCSTGVKIPCTVGVMLPV